MNLEQGIIKIKHINRIHATNNHNILTTNGKEKKKKKNKWKNETRYLLHEHALQHKNILEIKEVFTSLRSEILYLQKRSS